MVKDKIKEANDQLIEKNLCVLDLIGGEDDPFEDLPSFLKAVHYNRKDDLQSIKLWIQKASAETSQLIEDVTEDAKGTLKDLIKQKSEQLDLKITTLNDYHSQQVTDNKGYFEDLRVAQDKNEQLQKKKNTAVDNLMKQLELSIAKVDKYAKDVQADQTKDNSDLVVEDKRLNDEIKALYESSARSMTGLDK